MVKRVVTEALALTILHGRGEVAWSGVSRQQAIQRLNVVVNEARKREF